MVGDERPASEREMAAHKKESEQMGMSRRAQNGKHVSNGWPPVRCIVPAFCNPLISTNKRWRVANLRFNSEMDRLDMDCAVLTFA